METLRFEGNSIIHSPADTVNTLAVVLDGRVDMIGDGFTLPLKKGCILGLCEQAGSPYSYTYKALDTVTLCVYTYSNSSDYMNVLESLFNNCETLISANAALVLAASSKYNYFKKYSAKFLKTLQDSYEKYKEVCNMYRMQILSFPFIDELTEYVPEVEIAEWINDYYDQITIMPKDIKQNFYGTHPSLGTAMLMEAATHISKLLSVCTELSLHTEHLIERYFSGKVGDIADLYVKLADTAAKSKADKSINQEITENIGIYISELGKNPLISQKILLKKYGDILENDNLASQTKDVEGIPSYEKVENSMETILDLTSLDEAEKDRFRSLVKQFRALPDKNSTNDEDNKLRQEISKSFFDVYEAAINDNIDNSNIPTILKMFFYYGYIDENLIGKDNALTLYDMAESTDADGSQGVYTMFHWLKTVYKGINEPSRNEFDQDYPAYLRSQKQSGYITEEMEKRYLSSPRERMRFEMLNFFRNGVRMASGRPTVFCPLLSQHNIIRPLESINVTAEKILNGWKDITKYDYSCFYRPCFYSNPDYKLTRENILLEVLPNVILMPTIGQRGGLWQETAGVTRDTASRMFLPAFLNEDLLATQQKLAAEFRWNICKKVQGARWNDVTDHSLTSDYFDYLQFYKKNNELSAEAKEKVRNQLANNRNNFRNVFVADYLTWLKYEMKGAPHANKLVKRILFTYCPPSKEVRAQLATSPLYKEQIVLHEAKATKKHKVLGSYYAKFSKDNSLPIEITKYVDYFTL